MGKIKTRENAKDIKVLDKSAVVGQRMKNAFIRSKQDTAALMDDRQASPNEYAGDKVEYTVDNLTHDTANAAVSSTKTAVRQGRKLFQRQREKKAAETQKENVAPTEQTSSQDVGPDTVPEGQPMQQNTDPVPDEQFPQPRLDNASNERLPQQRTETAPEGRLPKQRTDAVPQAERPTRYRSSAERRLPTHTDMEPSSNAAETAVERGRNFTRAQAERKIQTKRQTVQHEHPKQIKPQGVKEAPPQVNMRANPTKMSVKPTNQTGKKMKQTAKDTGKGAKSSIKNAKRTIKTAQRTAKGTVKTAQHTSKAAIKTAENTAKAAQKTAQATAKAAKVAAQAARATAKTAVAAAKASAKAIAAAVKATIAAVKALAAAIAAGGWIAVVVVVVICLIGLIVGSCFGIFFSGQSSNSGQSMPEVVREINQDYESKLEEIKTSNAHNVLEMAGSHAVWPDVLAIYAVKTTTDPNNPQEVATMDDNKKALLKEIFWAMNEVSSRTETNNTTQIVETDDGEGNIVEEEVEVTVTTLYITVTHKTADEMADVYNFTADQRQQLAELLAEENREMWNSVLYGIGLGDGEIVVVALSQIGNVGGRPYWSWYGFSSRVEWCACFVSWCANECGYLDAGVIPRTAGCISGSNWFKERGLWQDNSYEPRSGDIIYFDWNDPDGYSGPQDGLPDHVGIVEKVENGYVYTVEGNSGDSCRENRYPVGHYEIYGYGTPAY